MIQINNLVEWQLYDEKTDAIFPWFTHPFLTWLDGQDLKDKLVLEFGSGRSTRWWRKRCSWVTSIEANAEWSEKVYAECGDLLNGLIICKEINEGDQSRVEEYVNAGDPFGPYDIVVVDGILRNECLQKALSMPRPLLLVADNFYQSYVWMSDAAVELMKPYPIHVFEQENHTNNDGVNKWKTVYWNLTNEMP